MGRVQQAKEDAEGVDHWGLRARRGPLTARPESRRRLSKCTETACTSGQKRRPQGGPHLTAATQLEPWTDLRLETFVLRCVLCRTRGASSSPLRPGLAFPQRPFCSPLATWLVLSVCRGGGRPGPPHPSCLGRSFPPSPFCFPLGTRSCVLRRRPPWSPFCFPQAAPPSVLLPGPWGAL